MKKDYVFYYDLIKIIAAFMVCFYHLGMLDVGVVTEEFYIPNFNRLILNFCAMSVPLFFMVNGALMLRRAYSWKEIIRRAIKLYFLYYFWMIVIGEIGVVFFQVERLPLQRLLMGKRTSINVHLWFLSTIAILTLMVPVLKKIYESKSKKMLYGIMLCLVIFPFTYNYFVLVVRWFKIEKLQDLFVTGAATMYSILYFFLGKLISDISVKQTEGCKKYKILAVAILILGWVLVSIEVTLWSNILGSVYDGVNSSFPTLGALFMAAGVFYLLSGIQADQNRKEIKLLKLLADNIMGVYIFHNVCIPFVRRYIHGNGTILVSAGTTLVIMLGTALLTGIMKKIPVVKMLVNI